MSKKLLLILIGLFVVISIIGYLYENDKRPVDGPLLKGFPVTFYSGGGDCYPQCPYVWNYNNLIFDVVIWLVISAIFAPIILKVFTKKSKPKK